MWPIVFFNAETEQCIICNTPAARRRFFDNRDPRDWRWWEASAAEIRRWGR